MSRLVAQRLLNLLPPLALALFAGRILSEVLRAGPLVALLLTLILVVAALLSLRRCAVDRTWPMLILLAYVLYPSSALHVALWVALAALLAQMIWTFAAGRSFIALRPAWLVPSGLAVGGLVLYVATLAPGVLPADSGELQLVAAELGIAHPPGFPLYTLLAHLMTRLPIGSGAAWRVNLFSALTAAGTLLLIFYAARQITGSRLSALMSAAAIAGATTFWSQATTANVRSLTALFAAGAIFLLVRMLYDSPGQMTAGQDLPPTARLLPFLLVTALGIGHHGSLLFIAALLVLILLLRWPRLLISGRFWLSALAALAAALLPLLYFPWRAAAGAADSGSVSTLQGVVDHVLATGFRGDLFYFRSADILWHRLLVMLNVMTFQFTPWLLGAMVLGAVVALIRNRWLAAALVGPFLVHSAVAATYRAPQTVEYMLPAYVMASLLLGITVDWLRRLVADQGAFALGRALSAVALALVTIGAISQIVDHWPSMRALSQADSTSSYVQPILEGAPENAIVLADWHWSTPLTYLQRQEGLRPDLTIEYVFPTAEAYATTWARRIGEELDSGRAVVSTHSDDYSFALLPPSRPLGEAFLFGADSLSVLPDTIKPTGLKFGGELTMLGIEPPSTAIVSGHTFAVTIAWQGVRSSEPLTLFLHLVGRDGRMLAIDEAVIRETTGEITLTRFRLTPALSGQFGSSTLMIGARRGETLLSDDGQGRVAVATLGIDPGDLPPFTGSPVRWELAKRGSNLTIYGFDWDSTFWPESRLYIHWQRDGQFWTEAVDLPSNSPVPIFDITGPWGHAIAAPFGRPGPEDRYIPLADGIVWTGPSFASQLESIAVGRPTMIVARFAASRPVSRDYVVSLALAGQRAGSETPVWQINDDGVPATGAIPTLKWVAGSRVTDYRSPTVPAAAIEGDIASATLRLYDSMTLRTVPVIDERIFERYLGLPIGGVPVTGQ